MLPDGGIKCTYWTLSDCVRHLETRDITKLKRGEAAPKKVQKGEMHPSRRHVQKLFASSRNYPSKGPWPIHMDGSGSRRSISLQNFAQCP